VLSRQRPVSCIGSVVSVLTHALWKQSIALHEGRNAYKLRHSWIVRDDRFSALARLNVDGVDFVKYDPGLVEEPLGIPAISTPGG